MNVTVANFLSLYSHPTQTRTFSRQPISIRVAGNMGEGLFEVAHCSLSVPSMHSTVPFTARDGGF